MMVESPLDATLVKLSSEGGEESLEDTPESDIAELCPLVNVPGVPFGEVPDDWSFASEF